MTRQYHFLHELYFIGLSPSLRVIPYSEISQKGSLPHGKRQISSFQIPFFG